MKTITIALLASCAALSAQTAQERNENANRAAVGQAPIYRVTVTERTAKAISYQHRSGATKIDFSGTALMPKSHGEAKVEKPLNSAANTSLTSYGLSLPRDVRPTWAKFSEVVELAPAASWM